MVGLKRVVALLISVVTLLALSIPASAISYETKTVELLSGTGSSITVENVNSAPCDVGSKRLYEATATSTVTINNKGNDSVRILQYPDGYCTIKYSGNTTYYEANSGDNFNFVGIHGQKAYLSESGLYQIFINEDTPNKQDIYVQVKEKLAETTPTTYIANPTTSTILVNGKSVAFDAYNVNDNNYFKLRDLAYVLNGTGKQFEVAWDGSKNAINLTSSKPYTAVGGEMAAGSTSTAAALSTSTVYIDGVQKNLTAYTINGNNYFKLRDLGQAFNFGVTWNGTTNTVGIDTSTGYVSDTSTLSTTSNSSSSTDSSDYNDTQTPSVLPGGTTTNTKFTGGEAPSSKEEADKIIEKYGTINLE